MSRRRVRPHRGGRLVRARHLGLLLSLGLALSATTIAQPVGATPQNDLASKTAQARHLESQIAANSQRADILDEQLLQQTKDLEKQKAQAQDRQKLMETARREVAKINGDMQQLLSSTRSDI